MKILLGIAVLTLLTFGWAAPASAEPTIGGTAITFSLDPVTTVQFILAVVLPILVALVTTRVTSSARKAWLLAGLTLVTSVLAELARALTDGAAYDVGVALFVALPAFAISVATHYGLWKPTGASDRVLAIGVKASDEAWSSEVGSADIAATSSAGPVVFYPDDAADPHVD